MTSRSLSPWTGSCEYAWTAFRLAVTSPPSVIPGYQLGTPAKRAPPRGAAWPVIKLSSPPKPCPYLEIKPKTPSALRPLSARGRGKRGTSGNYTSHPIKPFSDWETVCLQSQHKSARHFLNCTTHPHRGQNRATASHAGSGPPCASHSNGVMQCTCSHLSPAGRRADMQGEEN